MSEAKFIPLEYTAPDSDADMQQRAQAFYRLCNRRRTVRDFSDKPVPRAVIEQCLLTAGTAPSGANQQPWHFAVVSDPAIKKQIREGAEEEERAFYSGRAPQQWLDALAHLGTNAEKPFLEVAPYLIVVFKQSYGYNKEGEKIKHYYVPDSVGISCGMLLTALHNAGLVTLTHTPSPMNFLNQILERPKNESPAMIIVAGYPEEGAEVPNISRKTLTEISSFF